MKYLSSILKVFRSSLATYVAGMLLVGGFIWVSGPAPAEAYFSHYSHRYGHRGHHGFHRGFHGGHHRFGFRYRHRGFYGFPHRSYRYHRGLSYRRYSGRHHGGHYTYHPGLIQTILAPIFGYHSYHPVNSAHDGHDGSNQHRESTPEHHERQSEPHSPPQQKEGTGTYDDSTGHSESSRTIMDTRGPGWQELAQGRYRRALSIFGGQASNNPQKGVPKVGYALASAASGDLHRGVWAMRRAFRIDPDSIHYVTISRRLQPSVNQLIDRYEEAYSAGSDRDFMLSSLYYVNGDKSTASRYISEAINRGDSQPSERNLARIIEREQRDQRNDQTDPSRPSNPGSRIEPRSPGSGNNSTTGRSFTENQVSGY